MDYRPFRLQEREDPRKLRRSAIVVAVITVATIVLLGLGNPWSAGFANIPAWSLYWGTLALPDREGPDEQWLIHCVEPDGCIRRASFICRSGFELLEIDRFVPLAVHNTNGFGRGRVSTSMIHHLFVACRPG